MSEAPLPSRDGASVLPSKADSSPSRVELTESRLRAYGVVPVVELRDSTGAEDLFAALSAGGIPAAEITLRTPGAASALEQLIDRHPEALLGAGTVRNLEDARRVVGMGASFVVSPGTDEEIIEYCFQHDVLALPGVCTPTEIMRALRAGARLVKFFPAELAGGLPFLKALAGPFGDVSFVPTGGITEANLENYLRLPQVAACGGSWIVSPQLLAAGRFEDIETLVRKARDIVGMVRGGA